MVSAAPLCQCERYQIIERRAYFVAYDSADVWANSGLFYLDDEARAGGGGGRTA